MSTIVTGLQQTRIKCLLTELLRKEVSASVDEAASQMRSEGIPSGSIPVVNFGRTKEFYQFFLRKGCHISTFIQEPSNCSIITGISKRSVDKLYICSTFCWFRLPSTQNPNSLTEAPAVADDQQLDCICWSRFVSIPLILLMKGTLRFWNPLIHKSVLSVSLRPWPWVK